MTSFLELFCHDLRCEITPGLGGAIAGLWLGESLSAEMSITVERVT